MYLKKEDRAIVLPLAWFLCFLLVNLVLCALQHFTVTFSLLIENLTQFLWIKLLFPSIFTFILSLLPSSDLSDIKSKTTGDGQHGTARMATELEKQAYYEYVKPSHEKVPGFVVGLEGNKQWIVDVSDKNLLLNAPPGTGKTTRIVVPNLYYNAAVNVNTGGKGASMLLTDMKGDLVKICGAMLEQCGYSIAVLNLRYPFNSHCFNLINNTNRHMERYLKAETEEERLMSFGTAERYAKMLAQSIVYNIDTSNKSDAGQYFNETAQGLLTGIILLVSEYACKKEEKHILSVFNLIIELNGASETASSPNTVQRNKLQELLQFIDNDRIRQHVGPAMSADIRSSMNIFSSALGKLVGLIDAELEQMISSHSPEFDDVDFIKRPTAIFIVCPDDIPTRYFFGSMFLRYFLNDLIAQARAARDGTLERQVFCYWDEFGNMPPIKDVDTLFSAARSAGVRLMPVIQSLEQLHKSYSQQTSKIILSTCQITMTSQVAPLDISTAEQISKALGNKTIQSGSVSQGSKTSRTVQLMSRPLMTPTEITTMKMGQFICMSMGVHPMVTQLKYYKDYLRVYPEYTVNIHQRATIIEKMTADDVKHLTKAIKLKVGMFG